MTETELERIRSAYRARDADSETPYRWDNPGYVAYMQSVERAVLRALADVGVPLKGARVLDVGCGSGYFLHRLQEYGAAECHGIDLMENRIAEGQERYPTLELVAGTATGVALRRRAVRSRDAVHVPLLDSGRRRPPRGRTRDAARRDRGLGALV